MFLWKSKIIERKEIAEKTWEVKLENPKDFSFNAGQYIWLSVPNLISDDPKGNRRAFSITSPPSQKDSIALIFRDTGSGYKKSLTSLQTGSEITFLGPFGSEFTFEEVKTPEIVIIAGGTGITPFLSILRSETDITTLHKSIIYLNSTPQRAFCVQELNDISSRKNYAFINKTSDHFSWEDIPALSNKENASFFVSGLPGLIDHVVPILMDHGIKRSACHFERSYPHNLHNFKPADVDKFLSDPENLGLLAIQQSNHHIVITDENGIVLFGNKASQKITGFTLDEMKGNTPRLWGGLMSPQFYKELWNKKLSGESYSGQLTNRRKNGEIYYVQSEISPILVKTGVVVGYVATEEDITQRVQLEVEIEHEKAKDEALLASIGDGVISVDGEGKIIYINTKACGMLKLNQEEVAGKKHFDILAIEDDKGNFISEKERPMTYALIGTTTTGKYYHYFRKDKTKFPAAVTVTPVILENKIIGAIEVFRDSTREAEVDRMKTEFISLASHQLRTPLSAMKWFLEMLLGGDAGELTKEQKEMIQNIDDSNERMIALVNSLLNVSRIESGRISVDPVPADLRELVDDVLTDLKAQIEEKHQSIKININQDLPKIYIDPKLIRQVYMNLLTNAIKYTQNDGEISISISKKDDQIISQISDNGYGIPAEDHGKVFQKFYRGDNIVRIVTDGNGLGMYLVKAIIESSNGKIWFESTEGKGTSFYFSLPVTGS